MGGVVSLLAGARIGARAIVNLDGSFPAGPAALAGQQQIAAWLDQPDFRPRLLDLLRESFFLPAERGDRCEEILGQIGRSPMPVLRFLPEQIGQLDAAAVLPFLPMPLLYVGAAHPRFDEPKARCLNPRADFIHLPSAGHFLHVFASAHVAELVARFADPSGRRQLSSHGQAGSIPTASKSARNRDRLIWPNAKCQMGRVVCRMPGR